MSDDQLETWKNPTQGRVWINRLDHHGDLEKVEIIGAGRTFHISPKERRLNQEMAAKTDLDIFTNGTLTPLRLIEGTADAEAFAQNPNLMTEDDMRGLFKPGRSETAKVAMGEAFIERLASIKNTATLERLLSLARDEDAPLSRVEAIQQRLAEVQQPGVFAQVGAADPSDGAPSSAAAPRPTKRMPATRAVTPN